MDGTRITDAAPRLLIGGDWREAGGAAPIPVVNPCTGEVLWHQPACDAGDVAEALAHAEAAQEAWAATHGWERARILRRVAGEMRAATPAIARALSLEIGRPRAQAAGEVGAAIEQVEWFAGEAERLFGRTIPSRQGGRLLTEPEPVGICAAFTAWNFPVNLPVRKMAPALAAGCAILVRPSEQVPLTSTLILEAFVAGGVPAGVVQLLLGRVEDISPAIMASDAVRKVSLTGSTRVGQAVMAEAARTMKRLSLELGGHGPVVVCADADVEAAALDCAAFKFRNAGQVCIAPNRFYVEEAVADRFAEVMPREAEALVLGDSQDEATTMGPLTLPSGRDKVERLIAQAVGAGARLVSGGRRPEGRNAGWFLAPTVLADMPDHADLMAEEPFGPVAALAPFRELDEAIARANATPYGLAAYAFTGDQAKAPGLSRRLRAGMVGINTFLVAHAEAPFGGVDHSGTGREGGPDAIGDYQTVKLTHLMPR
jgi:succinate-semialdehyde dehydrogenase/glutarate-semialdehyde dehydrogenase